MRVKGIFLGVLQWNDWEWQIDRHMGHAKKKKLKHVIFNGLHNQNSADWENYVRDQSPVWTEEET